MNEYINLDENNIEEEHICCAIGDPKHQAGVDKKKEWIKNKLKEEQISNDKLINIINELYQKNKYHTNIDVLIRS